MTERRFLASIAMILRGLLRMIDDRLARCCRPERPGRVMLSGSTFLPVSNLKDFFAMVQKIENIRIRGDVLAYVSAGPVVVLNGKQVPMDPQPAPSTLTTGQNSLDDFYVAADGRVVIMGSDAQQPDAPWDAMVSAADGDADNLTISGFYDPDAPSTVDGGQLGELNAITDPADLPSRA